eukprot:CAMPEP_0197652014 /NCGR_PEP_ID=MMETSP1338-20131121/34191_1 /TAXON_ID=43686 ORGANISM="Pelagodinium beii, Strain RCC1491" /NCGR_SAMPLE_ID=MMETSP1338 /ASSEMBLY_ACC=CAM_ASM_000754 /LENGTH=241 /DNA_ID=CAMNT_0043226797 /DNA_START=77 /DNA_END=799 /DNA_ORIENTATION=+
MAWQGLALLTLLQVCLADSSLRGSNASQEEPEALANNSKTAENKSRQDEELQLSRTAWSYACYYSPWLPYCRPPAPSPAPWHHHAPAPPPAPWHAPAPPPAPSQHSHPPAPAPGHQPEQSHEGNCVTAYHQTDPSAGASINKEGFNVNYAASGGANIAGQGLYFSTSIKATEKKAHHHGYCFQVQLCLGNSRILPRWPDNCCSYQQLQADGFDSATIDRGGWYYKEYVVYKNSQIKVEKGW